MKIGKQENTTFQSTEQRTSQGMSQSEKPLLANNFILMAASALLIIVGFILMSGGASGTDAFNPDIFSARRIIVGPLVSFLGFVLMAVAIVIKPKKIK